MRKIIMALERWALDEDSAFLAVGKLLFLIAVAFFIVVFTICGIHTAIYGPHEYATIDLTSDFFCASSHTEMQWVHHGKTSSYEPVTACDIYKRK